MVFILWHLFRHDRVRVHLTLLSDFMKTWCLAYFWGREGLCFGAGERMFRTGRVCLCVVVGRCGGEVFLEPVRGFCGVQNGWKRLDSTWECPGWGWKCCYLPRQEKGEGQYAGLWLQKGILPAMTVATRRVADSFSSAFRSIFVALSFVFCLFLVRFSIGLR